MVAAQAHGVRERTGLSVDQTGRAAWSVWADGAVGGPRAVAMGLAVAWGSRLPLVAWKVPGVGWLLDGLYEWVARHRRRIPGMTPWCVEHPDECEPLAA